MLQPLMLLLPTSTGRSIGQVPSHGIKLFGKPPLSNERNTFLIVTHRSLIAEFTAVPLWMTVELTVWVFYVFRRYTGLYFWSVLATTWGVTLHAIGFVLKDCVPSCPWQLSTTIAEIGWVFMVSGFSVVLYSRLHLVIRSQRTLRLVLAMIITDAFLFHVPTIVFQYGTSDHKTHKKFLPYMAPMERIQVLGFSIQEILISCIYIYATLQMLKGSFNKKIRQTTLILILIQIVVILCDVVVISLDYAQYFTLKAVIHSFVYAFKLQLEFVILNQFRDVIAKGGLAPRGLDALQGEDNGPNPPFWQSTPPSGSDDEVKRWWSSRSVSVNSPLPATPKRTPTGPVEHENTSYHEAIQGLAITTADSIPVTQPMSEERGDRNSEMTEQSEVGGTDVLDIERQYIGV